MLTALPFPPQVVCSKCHTRKRHEKRKRERESEREEEEEEEEEEEKQEEEGEGEEAEEMNSGSALEKLAAIVNPENKPTKVNWTLSWPSALEICGQTWKNCSLIRV